MALETGSYVNDLVVTNPTNSDAKHQGDDHLRLIKTALKNALAGFPGHVLLTGAEAAGATVNDYVLTITPAPAAYTTSSLILFKATHTNTGAVTLKVNLLAALDLKSVSGTALVANDIVTDGWYVAVYNGTNCRLISITKNYVDQLAFATALPAQISDGVTRVLNSLNGVASWVASGISSVSSTVTTDTTLTSASAGYQFVQMATMGKSLTLPDATTMSVGGPKFIVDNTQGSYPCGIRNSAGTLLMAVAAGGEAYVSIKSIATAAGVWSITGTNLEPGLITIDNTFSSTYSSTVLAPFVALDDNKSIHFLALASGFAAVAVDKITGAVGTPVTVSAVASMVPRTAFKITSTTAIVFYSSTTGTLISVVISLSGATTLAIGTPSSTLTATGVGVEDFSGVPKIAQLDSTHYLVSWATATGAGNTSVAAFEVTSGTTVTLGSTVNIIAANNVINSTTTYALTATTALVLYKSGAGAPYANNAVVISVSGTTCTVNTPAALTNVQGSGTGAPGSCVLSATKALVYDNNNTTDVSVCAVTVSGASVSAGTAYTVESAITLSSSNIYINDSATRYNPHLFPLSSSAALLWYFSNSGVSRAVIISESGGTITAGAIIYRSISIAGAGSHGAGIILPQGTSSFISLRDSGVADAWMRIASAHKISGTTITQGNSCVVEGLPPKNQIEGNFQWARTQSGVYAVVGTNSNSCGGIGIPIFKTNGDAIEYRGVIAKPCNATSLAHNIIPVIGERLVILFASAGTTVASSTFQLRLITVEIAA